MDHLCVVTLPLDAGSRELHVGGIVNSRCYISTSPLSMRETFILNYDSHLS